MRGLIFFIIMIMPVFLWADNPTGLTDEDYQKMLEFASGDGNLENWFMDGFLGKIQSYVYGLNGTYISLGQAIGATMSLLYLGNKAWGFLSGDKEWEIMPLLKPIIFGLIIANWVNISKAMIVPFNSLADEARVSFNTQQDKINSLRLERFKLQHYLFEALIKENVETQLAEQVVEEERTLVQKGVDYVSEAIGADDFIDHLVDRAVRLSFEIQLMSSTLIEAGCLMILRLCVYGMFLFKIIFTTIMIIIGPITFGFSIIGIFSNAYVNWLSKFIAVQFYPVIAYIVMQIGGVIQRFALQQEIIRYEKLIDPNTGELLDPQYTGVFIGLSNLSFGFVLVGYLLTALSMLLVPSLSSLILGSASATHGIASKTTRNIVTVTKL